MAENGGIVMLMKETIPREGQQSHFVSFLTMMIIADSMIT